VEFISPGETNVSPIIPKLFLSVGVCIAAITVGSSEARADFLVLCPSGGTAAWVGTGAPGGVEFSTVLIPTSTPLIAPNGVRRLSCFYPAGQFITKEVEFNNGLCIGGARLAGSSPVFNRPEFFQSELIHQGTNVSRDPDSCILSVLLDSVELVVNMTEECDQITFGQWSCPDSARQIVPDF
jgi:hypothetical protein